MHQREEKGKSLARIKSLYSIMVLLVICDAKYCFTFVEMEVLTTLILPVFLQTLYLGRCLNITHHNCITQAFPILLLEMTSCHLAVAREAISGEKILSVREFITTGFPDLDIWLKMLLAL